MKATGIVRRIDDLGRVVIPKEIRRTMRIREGDPLEIYTDHDGEVIFKKYSPMGELGTFVGELCESISKTTNLSCAICDRDTVIAAAGSAKKDVYDHPISADLENIMEERRMYEYQHGQPAVHLTRDQKHPVALAWPIITGGDVTGCVSFMLDHGDVRIGDAEAKLAQTAANFLSRQMES